MGELVEAVKELIEENKIMSRSYMKDIEKNY